MTPQWLWPRTLSAQWGKVAPAGPLGLTLGPAGPSGHTPGQPSLMAQVVWGRC